MSENNFEKKNTVTSKNQVSQRVYFEGNQNGSPRIMIVGNSITHHAPKPEIGWYGDYGMAASCEENDYVHVVIRGICEQFPEACFCIVQAAEWERSYKNCDYDALFLPAREFKPDIILCSISANIPAEIFEPAAFSENLHKLHSYLSCENPDTEIFESTSFFDNSNKNKGIKLYCDKYGAHMIEISDLYHDEKNLAVGLFEHTGVQVHPGDLGMAELGRRYLKEILNYLNK